MIQPDESAFPMNAVALISDALSELDPECVVYRRPIRTTDSAQSIGVFPTDWQPTPDSEEMRGSVMMGGQMMGESFPTLSEYMITIQSLILDTDEIRGISTHATMAAMIRATVARNQGLRLSLSRLTSQVLGSRESMRHMRVQRQRYLTAELSGSWLYMSVTQFWFQTEAR